MRELTLYSLSRSGSHALAHWIACNAPGVVVFRNCLRADGYDSLVYRAGVQTVALPRTDPRPDREPPAPDLRITSIEDEVPDAPLPTPHAVLLLRDPLNWLASRVFQPGRPDSWRDLPLWTAFARRWRAVGPGEVAVSFPDWFSSRPYRDRLAAALGIDNQDRGLEHVSGIGGGSSFDGVTADGRAQTMNVLSRWPALLPSGPFYQIRSSRDYAEALALGLLIFHRHPAVRDGLAALPALRDLSPCPCP